MLQHLAGEAMSNTTSATLRQGLVGGAASRRQEDAAAPDEVLQLRLVHALALYALGLRVLQAAVKVPHQVLRHVDLAHLPGQGL